MNKEKERTEKNRKEKIVIECKKNNEKKMIRRRKKTPKTLKFYRE